MTDKVALVTGSSSGLGLAIANALRQAGCRVIGVGRNRPQEVSEADFIVCDFSRSADVDRLAEELAKRTDRLDILVNNAGFGGYATWEELSAEDLRRMFEVDFFAPVAITKVCWEMLKQSRGAVVNMASVASLVPVPCMGAYSAVKAALYQYSQTLRAEASVDNIRVLTVCPGRISTGFSSRALQYRDCPDTPGNKISPDALAKKVLRSLKRNKGLLVFPFWYKFFIGFARKFPRIYNHLALKVWKLR